jgi:NAD(P)-dependent dehydrogenase (short-subunit alcohol dehydrogenase family)
VLIIGGSRGIGAEFVRQYLADGAHVSATARDAEAIQRLARAGARASALDVASAAGASAPTWRVDGEVFDTVVLNAGVYGPRSSGLQTPTEEEFDAVMRTNVLGAMRVLPRVLDALSPGAKLAVISSRMGSIGLRASADGWLYRASKAALNSVLKDVSLVLAGRAICVALHPGWVRTDMGGSSAALDVKDSVRDLRRTLAALTPADNGGFFNHDGSPIPW